MKRKLLVPALVLVLAALALSACASQPAPRYGTTAHAPAPMATPVADMQMRMGTGAWLMDDVAIAFEESEVFMNADVIDADVQAERRISTTAHIEIETYEFEGSIAAIRELVWLNGGFIEHADFSMHSWHWRSNYHYSAVLRVPGENYDSFLEDLRQIGEITWLSETTQDHTAAFFDASIRLETRTIEEERIIEMIERARTSGEIADLLELERLLRNVRLEIEGLTRQIDHIDRLVAFHTINLDLFGIEENDGVIVPVTLTYRTGAAFTQSIDDIVSFTRNFTVFFASIIAPAALLAALWAIWLFIRSTRRRLKKT